jgi:two-component system, chemotaxis family, CheB/CheR fusion protein
MTEEKDDKPLHLVVVGSSAGGIEALGTLLGGLPATFPAPVILAQHLDPNHESHLHTILQRKTEMPVVLVTGKEKLQRGSAYVVPANRHIVVSDGHVQVQKDHLDRPRPSIDLLLSSAAKMYAERLVAVILTGSGSDGAAGAIDVKQAGGTVVIQDPRTALYPSMPAALPPTIVDHVTDVERIPSLLQDLVERPPAPVARESVDVALKKILGIVTKQSDIDFHNYKPKSILRRIGRRMSAVASTTLEDYAQVLEDQPEEVGHLASDLLINVTQFFRDPDAFEFLRKNVLPDILDRARSRGRQLRLWSAGCSTGEEAYSLVMLVSDLLGSEFPQWKVKVFATDVDEDAINFARRGFYPANLLGSVSGDQLGQFFEKVGEAYRVHKPLRQMVIFGNQDIGHGIPFPRIDLILCRNLLIYFKPERQTQVLDVFAYSLAPTSGYLFLGKAESVRPSQDAFAEVSKKYKIYRCVGAPTDGLAAARARRIPPRTPAPEVHAAPEEGLGPADLRRLGDFVLRSMPAGVIVIDRSYHMVTSNPMARRLLQMREHSGEDFLHAARGLPYNEVRAAIDAAFRERTPVTLPEIALSNGDSRYIHLTVGRVHPEDSGADYAVVSLIDVTESVASSRRLKAAQEEQRLLVDELSVTNKRLGDLNKDLQDSNEELQAANEELLLAHEELQATNEEFEATNEELQATNEELETHNEEMQATNEELETTNEELAARSTELHELSAALGNERVRLAETMALAPFCVMILRGPGLIVDVFNAAATRVLPTDKARDRPFEEVFASDTVLIDGVRGAYRTGQPWTSPRRALKLRDGASKGEERTMRFVAVPTHSDGATDGIVLYGEDVTGLAVEPS